MPPSPHATGQGKIVWTRACTAPVPGSTQRTTPSSLSGNPERAGATRDGRQPESPLRVGEVEAVDLLTLLDVDASEIVQRRRTRTSSPSGRYQPASPPNGEPTLADDLAVRRIDPDERMRLEIPDPEVASTGDDLDGLRNLTSRRCVLRRSPVSASNNVTPGGSDSSEASPCVTATTMIAAVAASTRRDALRQPRSIQARRRRGAHRRARAIGRRLELELGILARARQLSSSRSGRPGSRPSSSRSRARAAPVGVKRVGLPARAIEREHELLEKMLTKGMHDNEALELGNEFAMPPER